MKKTANSKMRQIINLIMQRFFFFIAYRSKLWESRQIAYAGCPVATCVFSSCQFLVKTNPMKTKLVNCITASDQIRKMESYNNFWLHGLASSVMNFWRQLQKQEKQLGDNSIARLECFYNCRCANLAKVRAVLTISHYLIVILVTCFLMDRRYVNLN